MIPRRWLILLEYIAVISSVVGTFIALFSQSFIYSAIPISLALLLNLINRHQLEHLIKLNSNQRELSNSLTRISDLVTHNQQENQNFVPREEIESLVSAVEELHLQRLALDQSLTLVRSQLNVLTEQFKNRPELVQIETLTTVITTLQQYLQEMKR